MVPWTEFTKSLCVECGMKLDKVLSNCMHMFRPLATLHDFEPL